MDMLRHLCRDDAEALDLLDQVTHGRQGQRTDLGNNVPEVSRPEGNTRSKALRRLRDHAPELHAEVLAGNLTAHAAMLKAGFRRPTMTVPADPAGAVRALRRRFTDDQWALINMGMRVMTTYTCVGPMISSVTM